MLEEVEFTCLNDGCEEIISYLKVKEHELRCSKRVVNCAACGLSMPFNNLETHQVHQENARRKLKIRTDHKILHFGF